MVNRRVRPTKDDEGVVTKSVKSLRVTVITYPACGGTAGALKNTVVGRLHNPRKPQRSFDRQDLRIGKSIVRPGLDYLAGDGPQSPRAIARMCKQGTGVRRK